MSELYNEILIHIQELYLQKGWTLYRLAKESDLPYSSLNNMFHRNTQPSIPTLNKICDGLGITMSEFFDKETISSNYQYCMHLSNSEYALIENYRSLPKSKQELLITYLYGLNDIYPK